MKFTSLEDAFQANYIKSIPVLTHLDLTANEIKLLELILSYTRTGNQFYMNYADIANYLVVSKGKTKAKVVEKIVRRLCKAGYITKITTTNFNGKNGGSSANIQVDETFLEEQLHRVFNPERFQTEPAHKTIPVSEENTAVANLEPITELQDIIAPKTFIEELDEMDALDDGIRYIDAALAGVVVADGVMVKVIGEPDIPTAEATEPHTPELLTIETIKNKLRTMINHERYQGKESDIRTMLTAFDHKTVEEFNGFFNHILESVSKA